MARKELPEVNASSLADIAFLLLTFFLIATSMDKEMGIERMLPDPNRETPPTDVLRQDAMTILVNGFGQVMINDQQVNVAAIKDQVKDHVNNNYDGSCDYCIGGKRLANASRNPAEAVISLQIQKGTSYKMYLTVQNEIDKAYNELYDAYSKRVFGKAFADLDPKEDKDKIFEVTEEKFKKKIGEAKPKEAS